MVWAVAKKPLFFCDALEMIGFAIAMHFLDTSLRQARSKQLGVLLSNGRALLSTSEKHILVESCTKSTKIRKKNVALIK